MTKANTWLVKQEPTDYSWADLMRDGSTAWTGVRNYQARNHLRGMKRGDLVLFYHSGTEKRIVGIARVSKSAYADPTATGGDWAAVDLKPVRSLELPVRLPVIKGDSCLNDLLLVRNSRLSVMPVQQDHLRRILEIGRTRLTS